MEFRGYQGTYLHSLPPPESTPLFAENDSLYWLISKCCAHRPGRPVRLRRRAADPAARRAARGRREPNAGTALTSASSVLFETPSTSRVGARPGRRCPDCTPTPPTRSTPGWPASAPRIPQERLEVLEAAPEESPEVRLARSLAALEAGDVALARGTPPDLLDDDPWEWRALWMDGLGHQAPRTGRARWRPSTPSASRSPASWRPSSRSPSPASAAGCPRSPRGSTRPARPTDATYVAPASFGMARVRAHARRRRRRRGRARPGAARPAAASPESRQVRADVLLAGQRQRPRGPRPGDGQHRVGVDGRDHPPAATPCGSSQHALDVVLKPELRERRRQDRVVRGHRGTAPRGAGADLP